MDRKVLIITGSPRKGGNCDVLMTAFARGAADGNHEAIIFEAGRKNIGGCIACDTCWSKGTACSIRDDFAELEPYLETCDTLALVSPLYWYGFSAQLKAAVDKFYAYAVPFRKKEMAIKNSCLLMCAGEPEEVVFSGAVETYKNIVGYQKWNNLGVILVPGVYEKGDIEQSGILDQAYELGRHLK